MPPSRTLAALLPALLLAACASAPQPQPAPPPDPAPQPAPDPAPQPALQRCEELFQTLNTLAPGAATPDLLRIAAQEAAQEAEGCRATFLKAAQTPGAAVIAQVFPDLMLVQAFTFRMAVREAQGDTSGVCPDADDALARMRRTRDLTAQALDGDHGRLTDTERATLEQAHDAMSQQLDALEPFALRGCKDGAFDPTRFIQIDDLAVTPTMTLDACYQLVVAFAAFDLEQAEDAQHLRLIQLLEDAAAPCQRALTPPQVASTHDLERLTWLEILRGAPELLRTSRALGEGDHPAACTALDKLLQINTRRVQSLNDLQARTQDAPLRVRIAQLLEQESRARDELNRMRRGLCAL